ncbi:hypothetical protein D1B31_02165 [Neobacillus notoginsengisoli]|uniref:Uncharacterized protein n=1 Tax=Neobacillus notoginsengisoli TaxID=1578198 RepID=A0A417Z0G0_9BACI|nr:hypothetical protein [Neobacillus notoginsengisoli]RHW43484.1 hypothetical protein D1B31_02165 [Neobacillus notoginsengisoli]
MNDKLKGKIQILLIVMMVGSLVGAFVLFFVGKYNWALIVGAIFFIITTTIARDTRITNTLYASSHIDEPHKF